MLKPLKKWVMHKKIILPTDSWQETYGLKTLFPEDWSELIYRMKANDTLFQTFHR